ncbi:FAD-binding oxidoreductase [uncultured Algimonas sp.]|uniref:FAD-binding oxidoreductase n=1 Tax=uncultured Algimonas sp. TaxID=1547920 RepID=UPI0026357189|nr:FAD-binding oxidoreductase [uncultured Algimonas sp.]
MESPGINALKTALSEKAWTDDPDIIAPHLSEWRDKYFGKTPILLTPGSTDEVSAAVQICAEHGLPIVPQGGNTGLVGGQTPQGEVLMSLKRMTRIRDVNPVSDAITVEAGATLHAVQEAAIAADRKFPLTLSSEGSCTVGGVLSTNAGGNHVLKYGTTKDLVFGVEAVLADGQVFNGLTSLRKDNTGYDISRLFLGAEGTLGIITAATLKLFPQPGHVARVLMGVASVEDAVGLLTRLRGPALAMFEVMPRIGFAAVTDNFENERDPFPDTHPWYVLADFEVETQDAGEAMVMALLEGAMENGLIRDAVLAQSETQFRALGSIREHMSAGQKHLGGSIKQDITVPIDRIPEFFTRADAAVEQIVPGCRPVGFGHFGDGNIHYNIAQPESADMAAGRAPFLDRWDDISEAVFDVVDGLGGSISAEHGIGIMKRETLAARADPVKMDLLHRIKTAMDPDGLMNPRVML